MLLVPGEEFILIPTHFAKITHFALDRSFRKYEAQICVCILNGSPRARGAKSIFCGFLLQGSAKLEKAEILQMTVDHLKMLHTAGGKGICH